MSTAPATTPTTAPETPELPDALEVPGARIAGRTVAGEAHDVHEPGSGALLARAGWVGAEVAHEAVVAATAARAGWAATPARERARALRAVADDLRAHTEELAALISAESGKRLPEAIAEVAFSAQYFEWFAEAAAAAVPEEHRSSGGRDFRVRRVPVGVVTAVSTWNFPLSIPARKVAAALAAGCPVVLKASERTPCTADSFVRLCEPHLPTGAIGSVMGDGAVLTPALVDHPDVAALTFTGSTAVGRELAQRCARTFTRSVLELGGRAPFVVRPDARVEEAVEHLLVAKLRNNGESCIAANNVFVHASLAQRFCEQLRARLAQVRPGPAADPASDLGPLVDSSAAQRLSELVRLAEQAGDEVTRGPGGPEGAASGDYLGAALVVCGEGTALWDQEVFGPVIALRVYSDEDAVVEEVRSWGTGLAGYVCGQDLHAAQALAERLPVGIVGINTGTPNTPEVPFGGLGASGWSREGGMSGYLAFTEEQTVATAHP